MWKPVITCSEQIYETDKKIQEIAALLSRKGPEQVDLSLLNGSTGIAIFLFYYARYKKSEFHLNLAGQLVMDTIDKLNNSGLLHLTYSSGITGVFWGINHLVNEGFLEIETDELFMEADEIICKEMVQQVQAGNFDYLHGGMGMMLYLLQRNKKAYNEKLEEALDILKATALSEEEGKAVKWSSTVYIDDLPHNVYNLSLSHGITSIINILARYLSGINDSTNYEKYKPLLAAAINYLKKQQNPSTAPFCFPNYIFSKTGQKFQSKRMAWCYGDLGISTALWTTGDFLKDESLKKYSLEVLKQMHKENAYKLTGIEDGALCHGTAGIAHIYQRLYNYTKADEFKTMAAHYFNETLNFTSPENELADKTSNGRDKLKDSISLLTGNTGIGLSLISSISGDEPKWDECLLLS